jgi:hypothetical protein
VLPLVRSRSDGGGGQDNSEAAVDHGIIGQDCGVSMHSLVTPSKVDVPCRDDTMLILRQLALAQGKARVIDSATVTPALDDLEKFGLSIGACSLCATTGSA